jgi:hypothetical protein
MRHQRKAKEVVRLRSQKERIAKLRTIYEGVIEDNTENYCRELEDSIFILPGVPCASL